MHDAIAVDDISHFFDARQKLFAYQRPLVGRVFKQRHHRVHRGFQKRRPVAVLLQMLRHGHHTVGALFQRTRVVLIACDDLEQIVRRGQQRYL